MQKPHSIRFKIVDVVGGGDLCLRTEPEPGRIFLHGCEMRMVDLIFDLRKLTFPAVEAAPGFTDSPWPLASVHISVPDAETMDFLAAYKDQDFIELEVLRPKSGKWYGQWDLNDVSALALELHGVLGQPVLAVVNAYKSVEQVFGSSAAQALTA